MEKNEALVREHGPDVHVPHGTKKEIWYAFIILTILTVLELALVFLEKFGVLDKGLVLISFILGLTFVKGYYIMAYFMHVRHERLNFTYSILLPFFFILFMLLLLSYESAYMP
jgi:cytochrome c oxidase subunit IV